jgi:dTDP-4-amino-4,6-dideoxygalactose transaminase
MTMHKGHAFHLFIIKVKNRLDLYNHLKEKNIFAQIHYIPVHTMPYYKSLGFKKGDFSISELYYEGCLSLPMYPTLTDEEQNYVIDVIVNFF